MNAESKPPVRTRLIASLLLFAVRVGLGLLFIYSGLAKLRQPFDFLATVYDYSLIGPPWGRYVAIVLPHLEIVIGALLVGGAWTTVALALTAILCLLFSLAQAWVLLNGIDAKCGCFGRADDQVSMATLGRALVCLVITTTGFLISVSRSMQKYRVSPPFPSAS